MIARPIVVIVIRLSKSKDDDSSDAGSDEKLPSEGGNEEARKNDRQIGKCLIKENE